MNTEPMSQKHFITIAGTGGQLVPAPALKSGRDSAATAAQLEALLVDAEGGARRICIAGLFIIELTNDLPHGQFGPWCEAWLPHRKRASIFRWKALALSVLERIGVKVAEMAFDMPLHEAFALPAETVPAEVRELRGKFDELVEGKGYTQLFFEFKAADESGSPRRGGDVTPRHDDGRLKRRARRTMKQISAAKWEAEAAKNCEHLSELLDRILVEIGPKEAMSWDTLGKRELEKLKFQLTDVLDGVRKTEARRK